MTSEICVLFCHREHWTSWNPGPCLTTLAWKSRSVTSQLLSEGHRSRKILRLKTLAAENSRGRKLSPTHGCGTSTPAVSLYHRQYGCFMICLHSAARDVQQEPDIGCCVSSFQVWPAWRQLSRLLLHALATYRNIYRATLFVRLAAVPTAHQLFFQLPPLWTQP